MAILSFTIPAEPSQPRSVNIENWRFMTQIMYNYGNSSRTQGTRIVLPDQTIDVMGYTPPMIREIIHKNEIVEHAIFSGNIFDYPAYCYQCGGLGKLDWVSSAMKNPMGLSGGRYARLFVRDKKIVMFYQDKDKKLMFNKVFSRVEEEKGYRICNNCKGTGLALDARQRIFSGMPGIKHRMKAFAWDGHNLPG